MKKFLVLIFVLFLFPDLSFGKIPSTTTDHASIEILAESKEIKIGNEILKSLNLRERGVKIISCPSCARQGFQVIETVKVLEKKLAHIKTPVTLSIIGCVVNGPGEAAMTDVGITGGNKGSNMLYLSGIQSEKVLTSEIINKVISEVEKKAAQIENK